MTLPAHVREVWPLVRDRIASIAAECAEPWIAEDVFFQLQAGGAYLWSTDEHKGFLVLQVVIEPHGRELHCWICYNDTGEPLIAYWEQLLDIAREQECTAITFENDRPGFMRAIPGLRRRFMWRATVT